LGPLAVVVFAVVPAEAAHEAPQAAVIEDQVHAGPLVADAQAPLAADEAEVAAELQEKTLQMSDEIACRPPCANALSSWA